jgi:hypothetical protein
VARLRSDSSDLGAAGLFLEELVRSTEDEAARAEFQAALDEVEIEWRARSLDRARGSYQELHGEDIDFVEQLVMGSKAVLPGLPDPEPSSLPVPLRRGSKWGINEETGKIVSSYYGRRYEVHVDPYSRQRQHEIQQRTDARDALERAPQGENAKDEQAERGSHADVR